MCESNTTKIVGISEIPNQIKPQKRQWSKWLSNTIAIGLANANETSQLNKSYWNTYHCADVISFNETAKGTSHYCKNRWCYTCSRIRTAKLINGYLPQIKEFSNPHFVTLTRVTCSEKELPNRLREMAESWKKITNSCRRKYAPLKGTKDEYKGLKKLECTLRPGDKYHPHFHLIVNTKEQAEYIQERWLKMHQDAVKKAQDIRKADERSHKELFKYFTKLTESKHKKGQALSLNYKRLDVIFTAMKGQVVYRSFGQLKMIEEDFKDEDLLATTQLTNDYANRLFKWVDSDWICLADGEMLIGKEIPTKVKQLIPPTIEEKEAIQRTDYLPPVTEIASLNDAFDLDEKPMPWQPPNVIEEKKKIEEIIAKMISESKKTKPKKESKNTNQMEMAMPG